MNTRLLALIALAGAVSLAGCGNIDSKPLEPVPNGGPGTVPNNGGFPNTGTNSAVNNVVENNAVPNNESTNNAVLNNSANAPTNSGTVCAERPEPGGFAGFESEPAFEFGVVTTVTSTDLSISSGTGGDSVRFTAEGIDLTNFFGSGDEILLEFFDSGTDVRHRVRGPEGAVEFHASSAISDGPEVQVGIETEAFSAYQLTSPEVNSCQFEGTCGLQNRQISSPEIEFRTEGTGLTLSEGLVEAGEANNSYFEVYVLRSTQDVVEAIETETCSAPGLGTAELSLFVAFAQF